MVDERVRRSPLLPLLLLVFGVALVALAAGWRGGFAGSAAPAARDAAAVDATPDADPAALTTPAPAPRADPSERVAEVLHAAPPTSQWTEEDVSDRLRVEVVDELGAPLPDLTVALFLSDATRPEFAQGLGPETCDAQGLAYLDPQVLTRSLEKAAELGVDLRLAVGPHPGGAEAARVDVALPIAPGSSARLVLSREDLADLGPLRVRVLDHDGRPAPGVRVELQSVATSRPGQPGRVAVGTTGADDGIARIDLSEYHQRRARLALGGVLVDYRVQAQVAIEDAPALDLGGAVRPSELVELHLPPTATVVTRVLHADGEPLDRAAHVMLWARPVGAPSNGWFQRERAEVDEHGTARFPHIGLGLTLNLSPQVHDNSVESTWEDFPGPARAGEVLEHELRLGERWPQLSFTARTPSGEPLASCELRVEVTQVRGQQGIDGPSTRTSTDEQGRATFVLQGNRLEGYARTGRVLQRAGERVEREGELALDRDFARGAAHDLGAVVLAAVAPARVEAPLIAAGTVLSPTGAAIPAARVSARPVSGGGPGRGPQAEVGEDGSFELRGDLEGADVILAAWAPRHVSETHRVVARGARDLRITLEPAARFRARLLLDPDVSRDLLEVRIRRGESSRSPDLFGEHLLVDGFVPGPADVSVTGRYGSWSFAEIADVELTIDEVQPLDPRLDPIDLRGALDMHSLRLVDPAGEPLRRASVDLFDADGSHGSAWTDPEGYLVFLAPRGVADLRVRPSGRALVAVTWSASVQTLTCPPASGR